MKTSTNLPLHAARATRNATVSSDNKVAGSRSGPAAPFVRSAAAPKDKMLAAAYEKVTSLTGQDIRRYGVRGAGLAVATTVGYGVRALGNQLGNYTGHPEAGGYAGDYAAAPAGAIINHYAAQLANHLYPPAAQQQPLPMAAAGQLAAHPGEVAIPLFQDAPQNVPRRLSV